MTNTASFSLSDDFKQEINKEIKIKLDQHIQIETLLGPCISDTVESCLIF